MAETNDRPRTRVDEIADGIHRISTAIPPDMMPGGFTFNQFFVDDTAPLLFHTGPRRLFPQVRAAIDSIRPVADLRYVAFSHYEADECGSLNDFLEVAPQAVPLCSTIAAMVSVEDVADRPPKALQDGEELSLGRHRVRWLDAPHVPHAWECGYLFESTTRTLFCGDLFTQGGDEHEALTEADILGPSLEMQKQFDYYAYAPDTAERIERLASTEPLTLACMHGASWRGDGGSLLRSLAARLASKG